VGLIPVATSALVGCFQPLDAGAATGAPVVTGDGGAGDDAAPPSDDANVPTSIVDGTPIALEDGGATDDPCAITAAQALEIRTTYCAACHAPPAKMGGFDFVLDDAKLRTALSSTVDAMGKPLRFLVPGDPARSRLYQRLWAGEMPPVQAPPLPPNPTPTVADVSVLRAWIANCVK
jgi:hypothetical protein